MNTYEMQEVGRVPRPIDMGRECMSVSIRLGPKSRWKTGRIEKPARVGIVRFFPLATWREEICVTVAKDNLGIIREIAAQLVELAEWIERQAKDE